MDLGGQKTGRPVNDFTRAASMFGSPRQAPFSPWVPASSWRWSGEIVPERLPLSLRVSFLLQHETLGHLLKGQGLFPRKSPSHLFSKDSLEVAEVWEGSGEDQETISQA